MEKVFDSSIAEEILDIALVGDPLETGELRDPEVTLVDDHDIGSNRVTVRRMAVPNGSNSEAIAVAFELVFHAAGGNRFEAADITLILKEPEGARFLDMEPKSLTEGEAVSKKRVVEKGMNAKLWAFLGGSVAEKTEAGYASYHRFLSSSGVGSRRARWSIVQNPDKTDGIPMSNRLAVIVSRQQGIRGDLMVLVKLSRPGLGHVFEAMRRLVLDGRTVPFDLDI